MFALKAKCNSFFESQIKVICAQSLTLLIKITFFPHSANNYFEGICYLPCSVRVRNNVILKNVHFASFFIFLFFCIHTRSESLIWRESFQIMKAPLIYIKPVQDNYLEFCVPLAITNV